VTTPKTAKASVIPRVAARLWTAKSIRRFSISETARPR
jgi:hypothetical protein